MPGGRSKRFAIIVVGVFIAAYVATVALYASIGLGHPREITEGQPALRR
jgi:hypothetical protein